MQNNNAQTMFRPARPQLGLSRHPIVRLPVGKELAGFAFPKTADPVTRARFASRKIPIISTKNLRHLGKPRTDIQTFRLKPFLG
jgi:hypothetical protein